MTKHIWIALIAGLGISAALAYSIFATHHAVLLLPQFVGFSVCIALRGVRSTTRTDFLEIAIPINAVIYAMLIFLLLRAFRRSESMPGHAMAKHIWIALIAGPVASVLLYGASKAPHGRFLLLPQYVGWWVRVALGNTDPPNTEDFLEIAGPINAAIYAVFIFLLLRAFRRTEYAPPVSLPPKEPYKRTFGTRSALRVPPKR